jgi:hypothetical protein
LALLEHTMPHDPKGAASAPPGTIDFEIADFADARRALDELPSGVPEVATHGPGYWEQRRRRSQLSDRAMASATISWLLALPPELRPHVLCERYARVGNAVAAAWPLADKRAAVLANLINDSRGRRHGFPPEVRREIEALLHSISPSGKSGGQ